MLNHSFTWNGQNSADFGIKVERFPSLSRPARKYDKFTVPGRNGDIFLMQDAWSNYDQEYEIYTTRNDPESLGEKWSQILEWLMPQDLDDDPNLYSLRRGGYRWLTDSYEPNVIRLAVFLYSTEIENTWNKYGRAVIRFNCRPERFTADAFTEITISGASETIINPTKMRAKPNILVAPYASDGIDVNGYDISFTTTFATRRIIIDCELKDCYFADDFSNANDYVILSDGWPVLDPGANTITLGTDITTVSIIPRWWRL